MDSPVGVEARFFVKIALFRCSFWQGFPGQSLQKMSIALAAIEQGWVAWEKKAKKRAFERWEAISHNVPLALRSFFFERWH